MTTHIVSNVTLPHSFDPETRKLYAHTTIEVQSMKNGSVCIYESPEFECSYNVDSKGQIFLQGDSWCKEGRKWMNNFCDFLGVHHLSELIDQPADLVSQFFLTSTLDV